VQSSEHSRRRIDLILARVSGLLASTVVERPVKSFAIVILLISISPKSCGLCFASHTLSLAMYQLYRHQISVAREEISVLERFLESREKAVFLRGPGVNLNPPQASQQSPQSSPEPTGQAFEN